ncbi:VIT1/CCC1 transporter family protein [Yinghuangia seranimata]|uniref:VIT1/CCC1 transporter family protein n=1 Tax=Yinghuangia seranimata TaxID=408067 RepID=UPI00248BD102|nr:VIT1/CCC1 transporter family protein [Yinghuangia seranimata]MDI2124971.1 VIT1/CCC1 transporter family protein [Yinghuangia seranimata]
MADHVLDLRGAELHRGHRDVTGGWLRPAVFGAMDGLLTNASLILGVAAGGGDSAAVVLTGSAGLVAGAFSMAAGEYTSVASQGELIRAEIATEKAELATSFEDEVRELAEVYRGRGVDADLAERVARQLSAQPEIAWRTHVREELGVDPDDLPSPYTAAGASFAAFALGALVPLLPLLLGLKSAYVGLAAAALGLAASGAVVARLTARPMWFGAARQLALAVVAATVTVGVGHLAGVSLA